MALTSLSRVKAFLNIPQTFEAQDPWLLSLIGAAEVVVQSYCGQNFEKRNYVEFYQGTGGRYIALRQRPVQSINNLWVDFNGNYGTTPGSFAADTLLTSGSDYVLDYDAGGTVSGSGLVVRIGTVWQEIGRVYYPGKLTAEIGPAIGNIKVDYVAGYSVVPQDLQYAVAWIVSYMRRTIKIGGEIHSERIGDYAYELKTYRIPQPPEISTARQILSRYREVALGGTP